MKRYSLNKTKLSIVLFLLAIFPSFLVNQNAAVASSDRNYIFLIDLSGSMAGEKLNEAKQALNSIIDSDAIDGKISIVGFNTQANTYLEPTTNKDDAKEAVNALWAFGNTALFDGIAASIKIANQIGNASIITITDGKDTSSQLNLQNTADLINNFSGEIHFLSIGQDINLLNDLALLAGSYGSVTDVSNISALLDNLKPLIPNKEVELKITKADVESSQDLYLSWMAVLLVSLFFIIFANYYFYKNRKDKQLRLELLHAYDDEETKNKLKEEQSIFYKALRFKPFNAYVKNEEKRLLGAGISLDVQKWIYIQITVFLLAILFFVSIGFDITLAILFSGFLGFGIGTFYLNSTRSRKAKAFAEELPDTLTIIASSLKSGLSFAQAIESVAKEKDSEVALQFRRVLSEVQLGRLITDALLDVAERMESVDFRWTISALSIQREVGGNLSEILTTTAETLRGRAEIRREIRSLSAEGRMSAYVLVALPFFMMLYLQVTKPEYLKIMFTQPIGIMMLSVAALLIVAGWLWVKKVVEVKIS